MKMHSISKLTAAVVLALGLSTAVMAAETTSSGIRGTVTTSEGMVVAGAQVTVTDTRTGNTKTLSSNDSGIFFARGLRVGGPYTVTVKDPVKGEKKFENVFLSLGDTLSLKVPLEMSQDIERISVTGAMTNASFGEKGPAASFGLDDLQNAPAINRDIKDLVRIDPRIYIDEGFEDSIQCAGANPRYNSLTVDGVKMNDNFGLNSNGYPTTRIPFSYDAIDQVAVELAPFDVQYGGFTACNINAVTKSGEDEFHGGGFFDFTSDSYAGDELEGDSLETGNYTERRFGANFGGSLIEDKLYFFVAYEKLEGAELFDRGPAGSGASREISGVSQQQFNDIVRIANELYQYDPGSLPSSLDVDDEKLLLKLDWNINDAHRASFVYNYNDGFAINQSDNDDNELELSNHYYERGAELDSYVAQFYSDWSDDFSTEVRIGYAELDNRQLSLAGTEFGEMQIRTNNDHDGDGNASRATVYLGADDSRHANKLYYETTNFKLSGSYLWGDHTFSGGYEYEEYDVFNLFIQEAEGEYRFSSVEDFEMGIPNRITYENAAPSNNINDAAAEFSYAIHTAYLQDEYTFIDHELTIVYGLRYDWYSSDDEPTLNPHFQERYGFSNQQNLDGEGLLQPRFGFNWAVDDNFEVRGGFGLYSGGNPNVWISNNYSNNGVTQVEVQDRSGTSVFDMDFNGSGRPGYDIPQDLFDSVATGTADSGVNVMDPGFELPSEWKYALGMTYEFENGYTVLGDILYSDKKDAAVIRDLSRDTITGTAPDGRPIYSSNVGRSQDFMLTNAKGDSGESTSVSAALTKQHDFGLDWTLAYAYTDTKEVSPMTSSVAFSNYTNVAVSDPENPGLSTSNYEIPHRFTFRMSYTHEFIQGYATRFSLFATRNEGRPYTYTFDSGFMFGDSVGFESRHLLYVPTGADDPNVVFADDFDQDAFFSFLREEGLTGHGGEILPRNALRSQWWTKVDVKIDQELPGFAKEHKANVFLVIENIGNMIDDEWGVMYEGGFPRYQPSVDASINDSNQYVFEEFIAPARQVRVSDASLWEIRLGLKYEF